MILYEYSLSLDKRGLFIYYEMDIGIMGYDIYNILDDHIIITEIICN